MRSNKAHRLAAFGLVLGAWGSDATATEFAELERGRALAIVGNCAGCHTAEGGKPLAGGRAINTPFGEILAPNLTPDKVTGIGGYTRETFYRAMHEGKTETGRQLYPAFPYTSYTKMTRSDVDALKSYLDTIEPVHNEVAHPRLPWPLSVRATVKVWNAMFFTPGEFKPSVEKSAEWNRGAYLVEGLAHCGACHTPKNILGADKMSERYQGNNIDNWTAPALDQFSNERRTRWTIDDMVAYLKTGRNTYAVASGPMAEVVMGSTQHVPDTDLRAMAIYLQDQPKRPVSVSPQVRPTETVGNAGEAIYRDNCSACHKADGSGVKDMFPSLVGNGAVLAPDATSLVRVIVQGAGGSFTAQRPTRVMMPAFGHKLSNDEVAALGSYVRSAWANQGAPLSEANVKTTRAILGDIGSLR
jgi:mono/diheme cytochrome c family protein